jgi:hypothetical protein
LRHGAPHPPQGLGRTGIHHALGRAFHVRSGNGTAGAGCLHQVEIDVELARERANRGKNLERARASACGLRARLARGDALFAAVDLADDGPGILLLTFRKLDQWRPHLHHIALAAKQPSNTTALRRRDLHHGLVRFD